MIILSIDIGIKNLGYIIFKLHVSNKIEIIDWSIINLCEYRPQCNICLERSSLTYNNKYYCEQHGRELDISVNKLSKNDIKKMSKLELLEICNINNILVENKDKRKNIEEIINKKFKCNYINPVDESKAKQVNIVDIGINIKYNLDRIFNRIEVSSIDKVLIENQIGPLANRMKTVQGMIAQYFIDRRNYNIEFVSSRNKLSQFTNEKMTYKEKKKISIEITKRLLDKYIYVNNDNTVKCKNLNYFNKSKKQDDLADSLLQGISYLKKIYRVDIVL